MLYVDPVARLALAIAQLALAVDSHNRRQKTGVTPSVTVPAVPAVTPAATPQAAYDGPPVASVAAGAAGTTATRPDNIATAADYQDL